MDQNKIVNPHLDEYKEFAGVKMASATRSYFFGVKKEQNISLGDTVVIETVRGVELGVVTVAPAPISTYKSELILKPILRLATATDIKTDEINKKDAVLALNVCQKDAQALNLDMHLLSCEYTLDRTKVIFSYLADERVDFRELLKILAAKLHTRIELRQIGTRDKAKAVGGIGVCGLPLCCSTFLNEFDGISISRAKNQMLAINIPKLSGHCGKLICCLKFEDETYTEEKKAFPDLGTKVFIDKVEYTVTNINIVSKVIKVEGPEDVKFLSFEDFKAQTNWKRKKPEVQKENKPHNNHHKEHHNHEKK